MENKFFYKQKVFYASNLEEIKSFEIKEIFSGESFIRLAEPKLNVGVLYSLENNEFSLMNFDNNYKKWEKSNWAFVAISLDENEVLRILSQKIISEEKKEIENLQNKICNSWDLIRKAQKYL